jgi:Zn-dependent peptidase ImmA (M78 family)
MEFRINNDIWKIELKDTNFMKKEYGQEKAEDEEVYFVFGLTEKTKHKIYINKDMCYAQQVKTLKHELTHCYIWQYGLYEVPNFNEEMVCDLVASINDFINDIVEKFKKEK